MNFGIKTVSIKDRRFFILIIAGIIFLNFIPMSVASPILIIVSGLMLGPLVISIFALDDFRFLFNMYLIGFGIRLFLSFLFYVVSFVLPNNCSPGFIFTNDGWSYSQQGWQICQLAEKGIKITMENFMTDPNMMHSHWSGNMTPYDFFTSHVYSITGHSPLSLFFMNCVMSSVAALFIYFIAKELFSKNIARISSLFAFFWPSFILWSTQNLKEPMIAMFSFVLLWAIFCFFRCYNPMFLGVSIFSVYVLSIIGFPFLVMIAAAGFFVIAFLFLNHLCKNKFITFLILGLSALCIIIFLTETILPIVARYSLHNISSFRSICEFLNYNRSVRAYGNLQILKNFDISNPAKILVFLPMGLLYAIFSPFPWQIGSLTQIIAVPETLIFYLLAPFTLKGIIFAFRRRFNQSLLLLLTIMSTFIFLALVEGNSGTMFRHRSSVFYLLFIFTSIGISFKNEG